MAELNNRVDSFITLLLDVSGRARPADLEAHTAVDAVDLLRMYADAHHERPLAFDGDVLVLAAEPEPLPERVPEPVVIPVAEPLAAEPFVFDATAIPEVTLEPAPAAVEPAPAPFFLDPDTLPDVVPAVASDFAIPTPLIQEVGSPASDDSFFEFGPSDAVAMPEPDEVPVSALSFEIPEVTPTPFVDRVVDEPETAMPAVPAAPEGEPELVFVTPASIDGIDDPGFVPAAEPVAWVPEPQPQPQPQPQPEPDMATALPVESSPEFELAQDVAYEPVLELEPQAVTDIEAEPALDFEVPVLPVEEVGPTVVTESLPDHPIAGPSDPLPFLNVDDAAEVQPKVPVVWWLLAVLLGLLGGLVGFLVLRKDDPAGAKKVLLVGIIVTVVSVLIAVAFAVFGAMNFVSAG